MSDEVLPTELPEDSLRRLAPLDGVRAFAIMAVVLFHAKIPGAGGGYVGVDIFFVLSGYLITSILLREFRGAARIQLGRFWVRRGLRLYPALIVVTIVAICLWPAVWHYDRATTPAWLAAILTLTYASNFGGWLGHTTLGVLAPTWSLAMEEQFYLIWPPILAGLLRRNVRGRSMLLGILAVGLPLIVLDWILYKTPITATPVIYYSPILNVLPLIVGCALALVLRNDAIRRIMSGYAGSWTTWVGMFGIVAVALAMPPDWKHHRSVVVLVPLIVSLASALLIAGLVSRRSLVSRVLALRPVAWFGRSVSYSLYLWHLLVFALVANVVQGRRGEAIAILGSVAVAVVSHYLVERPFLRLKHRFEPARLLVHRGALAPPLANDQSAAVTSQSDPG